MTRCKTLIAALTALFIGCSWPVAADDPLPFSASREDILTVVGRQSEEVWKLSYLLDDKQAFEFTVAPGYVQVITNGSREVYDWKLRRKFIFDQATGRFSHHSLYSIIGVRDFELWSRERQARVIGQVLEQNPGVNLKGSENTLVPFWMSSDLAHTPNEADLQGAEIRTKAGDGFTVTYDSLKVVEFNPAKIIPPTSIVQSFYRYLRHTIQIHPAIQRRMRESSRFPSFLEYRRFVGLEPDTSHWKLIGSVPDKAAYPMPESSRPDISILFDRTDERFQTLLVPVLANVASGDLSKISSPANLWKEFQDALINDPLEAALIFTAFNLQFGHPCRHQLPGCDQTKEYSKIFGTDQNFLRHYLALTTENQNRQSAIQIWESLGHIKSKRRYMIDLSLANAYTQLFKSAMRTVSEPSRTSAIFGRANWSFSQALKANPFVPSIYNDIGQLYFDAFLPIEAWILWDIGRTLPSNMDRGLLDQINKREQKLRSQHPSYFN